MTPVRMGDRRVRHASQSRGDLGHGDAAIETRRADRARRSRRSRVGDRARSHSRAVRRTRTMRRTRGDAARVATRRQGIGCTYFGRRKRPSYESVFGDGADDSRARSFASVVGAIASTRRGRTRDATTANRRRAIERDRRRDRDASARRTGVAGARRGGATGGKADGSRSRRSNARERGERARGGR